MYEVGAQLAEHRTGPRPSANRELQRKVLFLPIRSLFLEVHRLLTITVGQSSRPGYRC